MRQLNCIEIVTPQHVERMRQIYNENLKFLATHSIPERTYEEQQSWWNIAKEYSKGYLYEPINRPGYYVAFMVLRQRDGFKTPILGITKNEWGSGYGKEIIRDYIVKADGPLSGEQLRSNGAICHCNKKMGWQIIGERIEGDDVAELLFHPGVNIKKACSKEIFAHILKYLDMQPESFDFKNLNKPIIDLCVV